MNSTGTMTTLGRVHERVEELSRNHHDRLVSVRDLSFNSVESVYIGSECHRVRPVAQQAIANRLGIPFQYLRRCPPNIQEYNMNYWIEQERNEELLFRFDGSEVRAVFTPRYVPVDNREILKRLDVLDYTPDTPVQCALDDTFFSLNIPDAEKSFDVNGDRMRPGISITNSEVGLASLTIAAFVLRLVCTNGLIAKTSVGASYRHVSERILREFPLVLIDVAMHNGSYGERFKISLKSPVEHPENTIDSFNRQFQLSERERNAVEAALTFEYGNTMFHIVNTYTRAAQDDGLTAESKCRLQKVGGSILEMVK